MKTCSCVHNIRFKVDPLETMNVKQPTTISIDGVEVPSYQTVWSELQNLNGRLALYKLVTCIQGVLVILALIMQLLK